MTDLQRQVAAGEMARISRGFRARTVEEILRAGAAAMDAEDRRADPYMVISPPAARPRRRLWDRLRGR